jgi:hypothetical protein
MKGNARSAPRTPPHQPDDGAPTPAVNGSGVKLQAESAVAVEDPFAIEPFKPSSPSVEMDPTRLAPELNAEIARLQELLDQARKRLIEAEKAGEQWLAREQVYENLLEEKSELIRQLHTQVNELREQRAASPQTDGQAPNEAELISLHQELERERQQLKEDEEALMVQMRGMEVQMAGERASLARQRSDLQRLHNELQHQLELASRDAALRDRLASLYKLQEELQQRSGSALGGPSVHRARPPAPAAPVARVAPAEAPEPPRKSRGSGFFRRMFGRNV